MSSSSGWDMFGAVWGGSALKFKVYRRKEDGVWMKPGPHNLPVECTEEEAINITEELADRLWRGLLQADEFLLTTGERDRWQAFQSKQTSTVLERGWAHKYLAMCRPDLFSFHHSATQLRGHLLHFGLVPEQGRWLADWQWRALRLGHPKLAGCDPYLLARAAYTHWKHETQYWRLSLESESDWQTLQEAGQLGLAGPLSDDLRDVLQGLTTDAAKARLAELVGEAQGATSLYQDLLFSMREGDRVLATVGRNSVGIGVISGGYEFKGGTALSHRRSVAWYDGNLGAIDSVPSRPLSEFRSRSLADAARLERLLSKASPAAQPVEVSVAAPVPMSEDTVAIRDVLIRKGQCILFGPPGTGKTWLAWLAAKDLLTSEMFPSRPWASLTEVERAAVEERILFSTFHPAFSYEDFVEGYKPTLQDGHPAFALEDGVVKRAAQKAAGLPAAHHAILIIDEINRGNVASVMGELITLLELDKRGGFPVVLPYSKAQFTLPPNLWIIGTMNTADRSISLLDAALRRRFGFYELMPRPDRLDAVIDGLPLKALLSYLNLKIRQHLGHDGREKQVGHAYFMAAGKCIESLDELHQVMKCEVLPLLAEYCYDSYDTLREILGERLVRSDLPELNREVVENPDKLLQALMELVAGESSLMGDLAAPEDETA
ncbi:MAG: McrB family protein [Candidatus Xenobia bacterium]